MPHIHLRRCLHSIGLLIALLVTGPFDSDLGRVSAEVLAQGGPPAEQAPPPDVANDPEVKGAQRLFTAWLEGQIVSRHLPGVAVGVVADQELVWARGLRPCRHRRRSCR